MEKFYISRTEDSKDLPLPKYMTEGAAGMDLYAAVKRDSVIAVGEIALIPTGIKIALPAGYEAQIRPRSGLALTYGISLANSPGTIDSDYRGEINIILINHGKQDFVVKRGERIAQIVISVTPQITWEETETLPESNRSDGGFGHTGNK